MYRRSLEEPLRTALADTPVVLLNGARQTGKTTLARTLADRGHAATYISLDDAGTLSLARNDPVGFLAGLEGSVILDEVQRAPELLTAIKIEVDRQRTPGRFLLTGSANVLALPRLSESLAGRMEILTLRPLSQSEIEGSRYGFVDSLFEPKAPQAELPVFMRREMIERVMRGGYPEPFARNGEARRRAWFRSYITTILQRDVRDIADIGRLTDMPHLLALLASRIASLLNLADISRSLGMPYTTLHRYMALLEATYLVQLLPAWSSNLGSRVVKSPKLLLNDTGLAASLLGLNAERLQQDGKQFGALLENFVAMEVQKDIGWSHVQPLLYHFRTHIGQEVDLLLEDPSGRIVGIEVKASATADPAHFRGLVALAEAAGERFVRGIVLYTGMSVTPFSRNMHAVPISALWQPVASQ